MSPFVALALNGFREARRNRITVVVFVFAFLMLFVSTVALDLTVATFERVMLDLGLGVMSLISTGLVIFLGSGLIPREIERRTIFVVLSKPISRSTFVVGRFVGNFATIVVLVAIMAVLLALQLLAQDIAPGRILLVSVWGIFLQALVLNAVCFLLAASMSQVPSAVSAVSLYVLGHLSQDLYRMSDKASGAIGWVGKTIWVLMPQLDRLDFKARATYAEVTSNTELLSATGYSLGYTACLVVVACLLFERRDFK